MTVKALMAWSGGKDSALALGRAVRRDDIEVTGLLTTVTLPYDRITMHGVRRALLEEQAGSLGFPLVVVEIAADTTHDDYDRAMAEALATAGTQGVQAVVFGDVFLADVRAYREERLERASMRGLFPLWGDEGSALAREFIEAGFKAVLTCVDSEMLDGAFAGRDYDTGLLAELPDGVDPCGENGEFHTFVWDGPEFSRPVGFSRGGTELRDGRFYFQELVPVAGRD